MQSPGKAERGKVFGALKWTVANAVLQLSTKIGTLMILSRVLAPADFGAYNVGHAVAIIAATLAQYGAATNLVYLKEVNRRTGGAALFVAAIGSLLATAVVISICAMFFNADDTIGMSVLAFSLYIGVQASILVYEGLAKRAFMFRSIALSELIASLVGNLLLTLALAMIGLGFWSLVIGQFVYGLIRLGLLARASREAWGLRFGRRELGEVTTASWAITLAEFANMATVYSQRPVVGAGLGAGAAGLWSRFYQVVLIQLTALVQPVDNLVLPVVARKREKTDPASTIALIVEVIALVTVPVSILTVVIAPVAIPLAFGDQWLALIVPMQIAAITLFFRGIDRVLLSAARATGRMRVRATCQWLQLVLVTVAILAALKHGLEAVAWAYVLSQAVALVVNVMAFGDSMGISRRSFAKAIAPAMLFGLVSTLLIYALLLVRDISLQSMQAALVGVPVLCAVGVSSIIVRRRLFSEQFNGLVATLGAKVGGRRGR